MSLSMSMHAETLSLDKLSNGELCRALEDAEREERSLSDRRGEIHALIDGGQAPEDGLELAALSSKERELSARRLRLHQRIVDLRLEKSRRVDGVRAPLRVVESS
jgi:hypothetical protein